MRKLFLRLTVGLTPILLLVMGISTAHAEVPDPDSIAAVAIYRATVDTDDDWPDSLVNYNVTDPDTIAALLAGVEADTLRDCSLMKARNNAYIYIKFNNGSREVYHLFLVWSHFSAKGERDYCHYVYAENRERFKRHAQEWWHD